MSRTALVRLIAVYSVFSSVGTIFGQGTLTPPVGPPNPTMRTLDQVEPRGIIAQPISPATLPVNITTEGSYYLTSNLTAPSGYSGDAIFVNANNVTIDLNGFEIVGVPGADSAIYIAGGKSNVTIRNGTIRNWGSDGMNGAGNPHSHVDNVRALSNGGVGLYLDVDAIVTNCTASGNTSDGIRGLNGCVLTHCHVSGNSVHGIQLGNAAVVQGCTATANTNNGINVAEGSTITGCTVRANGMNGGTTANVDGILIATNCTVSATTSNGNTGWGISFGSSPTGNGASITGCTTNSNTVGGILATLGSTVSNCTVNSNGNSTSTAGIDSRGAYILNCNVSNNQGYGIYIPANGNRIVGNQVYSNSSTGILASGNGNVIDGNSCVSNAGLGISLSGTGNLMIRNMLHPNSYFVNPGNADAHFVSGTSAFANTDPTANIAY